MRPFKWGIALLVLVTFIHASANAARAWLIMPLFNHILLRGSAVVDNMRDRELANSAPAPLFNSTLSSIVFDETKAEETLKQDNYGLGHSPVPYGSPRELRDDDLAKLLLRTRAAAAAAAEQLDQAEHTAEPGGTGWRRALRMVKAGFKLDFSHPPDKEKLEKLRGRLYKAITLEVFAENLVGNEKLLAASPANRTLAAALSVHARHWANEALFSQLWDNLFVIFI